MDNNNIGDLEQNNITNNEKNVEIDNRILTPKERINSIDESLDITRKRLQNLSNMQDNIEAIVKNMNRCIDLLSKSIRGPRANAKFSDMRNSNRQFLIKASATVEEEARVTKKEMHELYKEKDRIIRENRINYNHMEEEQKKQAEKEQEVANEAREKIFNNNEENVFENESEILKRK